MEDLEANPEPKSIWDRVVACSATVCRAYKSKPISHWILLALSSAGMLIALPVAFLLSRVYYSHGGSSKWIISWVAVAGWPIPALVLIPMYFVLGKSPTPPDLKLVMSYVGLGFLTGADNLMYAYGYAYLPVSTASLLGSTNLIFAALFGYLLVKNRITACTINSIFVITAAMAIIALDSNSDRCGHVTDTQYAMGFVWIILASLLHGVIYALSELVFVALLGRRSFHVILEQQVMVSFFAFVFTTIGVLVNNDFSGMVSESKTFKGGRSAYLSVIIWGVISFHLGVLGATAILFLASTVLAGVLNSIRVPLMSVSAVIFLHDPMSGLKILSLIVSFWGFCCYVYGHYPTREGSSDQ